MMNWLAKLATQEPSGEERLHQAMSDLPQEDLRELAIDAGATSPAENLDHFNAEVALADRMGQELAHAHGDELEKQALWGGALAKGLGAVKSMFGGGGGLKSLVGGIAKNTIVDRATSAVRNAIKPAQPAVQQAGQQISKFAAQLEQIRDQTDALFSKQANLGSSLAGWALKNPRTAMTAAGAVGGALTARRDPMTGQKDYLGGAVRGGAVGLAAGHLGGKTLQEGITQKGWLGEKAKNFASAAHAGYKPGAVSSALKGLGGGTQGSPPASPAPAAPTGKTPPPTPQAALAKPKPEMRDPRWAEVPQHPSASVVAIPEHIRQQAGAAPAPAGSRTSPPVPAQAQARISNPVPSAEAAQVARGATPATPAPAQAAAGGAVQAPAAVGTPQPAQGLSPLEGPHDPTTGHVITRDTGLPAAEMWASHIQKMTPDQRMLFHRHLSATPQGNALLARIAENGVDMGKMVGPPVGNGKGTFAMRAGGNATKVASTHLGPLLRRSLQAAGRLAYR